MAARTMTLIALIFSLLCLPVYSALQLDSRSDLSKFAVPDGWMLPLQGGQVCNAENKCRDSLTGPASNKTNVLIALGRGTFNYSCEHAEPANAPAYIEQYTELYDATPFLPLLTDEGELHDYVQKLYEYDYGKVKNTSLDCIGAVGTLDGVAVITLYEIATFEAHLEETVPAPVEPGFNGLWSHSGSTDNEWEVYRVEMVGGAVPRNCAGHEGTFDVQYAAEYWFYKV